MYEQQIRNNKEESRFELEIGCEVAFLKYEIEGGEIALTHTLVPQSMAGKGVGSALAKHAIDYAHACGLKIDAVCPFIKSYMERQQPSY